MVEKIKVRKMAEKVNVKKILYNNVIEPSVDTFMRMDRDRIRYFLKEIEKIMD